MHPGDICQNDFWLELCYARPGHSGCLCSCSCSSGVDCHGRRSPCHHSARHRCCPWTYWTYRRLSRRSCQTQEAMTQPAPVSLCAGLRLGEAGVRGQQSLHAGEAGISVPGQNGNKPRGCYTAHCWLMRSHIVVNCGQLTYYHLRSPADGKWLMVVRVSSSLLLLRYAPCSFPEY